jgi:hypothetical protein
MTENKIGRPRLTNIEKAEKRKRQKEQLKSKLAKIRSAETSAKRKERASTLIKIGAIIAKGMEPLKMLEYLQNPKYMYLDFDDMMRFWKSESTPIVGESVIIEQKDGTKKELKVKKVVVNLLHI